MHFVEGLSSGLGLGAGEIDDVEREIMKATRSNENLNERSKVLLVLDGLDFLLAATGWEVLSVLDMVGALREVRIVSKYRLHALAQQSC